MPAGSPRSSVHNPSTQPDISVRPKYIGYGTGVDSAEIKAYTDSTDTDQEA